MVWNRKRDKWNKAKRVKDWQTDSNDVLTYQAIDNGNGNSNGNGNDVEDVNGSDRMI